MRVALPAPTAAFPNSDARSQVGREGTSGALAARAPRQTLGRAGRGERARSLAPRTRLELSASRARRAAAAPRIVPWRERGGRGGPGRPRGTARPAQAGRGEDPIGRASSHLVSCASRARRDPGGARPARPLPPRRARRGPGGARPARPSHRGGRDEALAAHAPPAPDEAGEAGVGRRVARAPRVASPNSRALFRARDAGAGASERVPILRERFTRLAQAPCLDSTS